MRVIRKAESAICICETAVRGLAVVSLVFMTLLVVIDSTLRYLFSSPIPGAYVLSQFSLVAIVALPLAYAQRFRKHIAVDLVIGRIHGVKRVVVELLIEVIACTLFGLATWTTAEMAWQAYVTQDYTMGLVEYLLWPAKSIVPLGCGLLCLRFVVDIGHYVRDLTQRHSV